MKWKEILRKDKIALLHSEINAQYAVVNGYNSMQPEDWKWNNAEYFVYLNGDEQTQVNSLNDALDCFRRKTEKHYVDKGQKYLEIYREDYDEGRFEELLSSLNLDDDQVGDSFSVYCIINEKSLKTMEKYRVKYSECYEEYYNVEAASKEEAERKVIKSIIEGREKPPRRCCNSSAMAELLE